MPKGKMCYESVFSFSIKYGVILIEVEHSSVIFIKNLSVLKRLMLIHKIYGRFLRWSLFLIWVWGKSVQLFCLVDFHLVDSINELSWNCFSQLIVALQARLRIVKSKWFGLEGTFKGLLVQPPSNEQKLLDI